MPCPADEPRWNLRPSCQNFVSASKYQMQLRTRGVPYVTLFLITTATTPGCALLAESAHKGITLSATWCIPGVKEPAYARNGKSLGYFSPPARTT